VTQAVVASPSLARPRFNSRAVRVRFELDEVVLAPRRYPYFGVVVGLVWSSDPESYAGSSVCYW
jgi:hypothetical protein